jgi:hypothetical protein
MSAFVGGSRHHDLTTSLLLLTQNRRDFRGYPIVLSFRLRELAHAVAKQTNRPIEDQCNCTLAQSI